MKHTFILLALLLVISCTKKSTESSPLDFHDAVEAYVKNSLFSEEGVSLDSLWMHSKDDLTDKTEAGFYVLYASNEIKRLYDEGEEDRRDMKLYAAIEADDLMEIKRPDIEKRNDSMLFYQNLMTKADNKRKTMDSVKVNAYLVNYIYKATDKVSKKSLQDTLELVVLKDNSIVESYDYMKRITPKITN